MRRNSINIGERSYCGDYGTINSAGELHFEKSDIKRVNSAGECTFTECKIGKIRSAGEINMISSTCADFYNIGESVFKGECSGDKIVICGSVSSELTECGLLVFRKVDRSKVHMDNYSAKGYFKADVFECCEPYKLDFDYDFKTMIIAAGITSDKELVCERFIALEPFTAPSVNAADILLPSSPNLKLGSVEGERIRLLRHIDVQQELRGVVTDGKIPKKIEDTAGVARIESVEGDSITLESVYCGSVCGQNIKIGDMCVINRVECSGELEISPKAVVNEIVRG